MFLWKFLDGYFFIWFTYTHTWFENITSGLCGWLWLAGWLAVPALRPRFSTYYTSQGLMSWSVFLQSLLIPCSMYVTISNRIIHNKHKKLGRYKEKRNLCGLAGCLSVPHKKYKNHMRNGLLAGLGRIVAVWLWLAGCGWLAGWLGGVGCLPGWLWLLGRWVWWTSSITMQTSLQIYLKCFMCVVIFEQWLQQTK